MQYLLLLASEPDVDDFAPGTEEFDAYMARWMDYSQQLVDSGAMRGGEALMPVDTATTVTLSEGTSSIVDGPFAETKEVIGGYYVIDVDTLDDALAWAAKIPMSRGSVEVRAIMPTPGPDEAGS